MTQEMKKSIGVGCCIIITVFIIVLILAAIPVAQFIAVYYLTGEDGIKAYIPAGSPAFYQFVLSCFAVLAAIAGYLTYKSREEAREEIKRIKTEMEKKKVEVDDYCARIKQDLEKVINEIRTRCKETIKTVEEEVDRTHKSMSLAETQVKRAVEEKTASIASIQLPTLGETENERDARELLNKGIAAYESDKIEEAIDCFSKAIGKNSNYADAYNGRGAARAKKGDHDGAITDYNEAIKLNPNHAYAYSNRGVARDKKGDYNGAITDHNKAIGLNPDSVAYSNRSSARIGKGDYDGAIADCTEAIRLNPNHATAYYNRSCAWAQKKDVQHCAADLKKAVSLDKTYLVKAEKDKDFDPVRGEPEIVAILASSGK